MTNSPLTVRARWIFPGDRPPLEGGSICVADGKIQAIEAKPAHKPDIDFGDAAILPGFVNAHTHLDLCGMRDRGSPSQDFTQWLMRVIEFRRQRSDDEIAKDIQNGIKECLRSGTTTIGDISATGASWAALRAAPVWAVVFREILGLERARAAESWKEAITWRESAGEDDNCCRGLSPHAPYSVRRSIFRASAAFARQQCSPVAIHLAETLAELELLKDHTGPFVDFLQRLGAYDPSGLVASPQEIIHLFAVSPRTLFVHGNYLGDGALPRNNTVVYCPRTHAAFGHTGYPLYKFLACGVRVALGTDSLASNPDLDLLAEARFVRRRHRELPSDELLRMTTLSGAEALGFEKKTGSLTVGKSADLIVIPIDSASLPEFHESLWESNSQVKAVMWRGRWLHDSHTV